jgi:hypothetical protein
MSERIPEETPAGQQVSSVQGNDDGIVVRFTFSAREYRLLYLSGLVRQKQVQVIAVVSAALVVVGFFGLNRWLFWGGLYGLLALALPLGVKGAEVWKSVPSLHSEVSYRFDHSGVRFSHADGESHTRWSAYHRCRSTQRGHYLKHKSRRAVTILPRRAFSPAGDAYFMALVSQQLGNGPVAGAPIQPPAPPTQTQWRRIQSGGFPAGWHPDPSGRNQFRYWDGYGWTQHVSSGGIAGVDPA